jgi:hypothetical protein
MLNNQYSFSYSKSTLGAVSSLFGTEQILKLDSKKLAETIPSFSGTYRDVFNSCYKLLFDNYRCEYIYKNEIVRQLLLNHPTKAKLYTEVEIYDSKADVVIMNGTSTVYEIKTELDTFDRLLKQLNAYKLVFDKINVVTHSCKLESLRKIINDDIGILVLNNEGIIEKIKDAKSNVENINPGYVFNLLHRDEYLNIIQEHFGSIPSVAPVHIFKECKKLFSEMTPEVAHNYMVKTLRDRKTPKHIEGLFSELPDSLKLIGTTGRLTKKECLTITSKLSSSVSF